MASYVKLIEQSGARVIPIPYNLPESNITYLLDHINGLILPGGADDLIYSNNTLSDYTAKLKFIVEYSKSLNQKGFHFPILAICLGFEQLVLYEFQHKDIIGEYDSKDYASNMMFMDGADHSRLYKGINTTISEQFNTIYNQHFRGFDKSIFDEIKELKDSYKVLTTSFDRRGDEFVSSVEHKKYPFYGLQFHPEKVSFIWDSKKDIPRSMEAIKFNQSLVNFFISEARQNLNNFDTEEEAFNLLVENYTLKLTRSSNQDIYLM
eukprot:CAMPEP_0205827692 /NCGR_PEP_ID=MMETSP0206-20130828/32827_1 /ASSEMBLY_ACC=CAM_ASM_000279 /TAXON_ID=36767 /ORGANISM="Euplotes focardii, Strain TN1" /LENGTH=263 /DNA_ID=CAMNT_0053128833 /DNA_START=143 /DNA_END=934 /DNA_ORIENTATION=+